MARPSTIGRSLAASSGAESSRHALVLRKMQSTTRGAATYCGRDSAVIYAWLEHLKKKRPNNTSFTSRTLQPEGKVWWYTNEFGYSSRDFRRLEDCIRACL